MQATKKWYQSSGVIAAVALFCIVVGRIFDVQITEDSVYLILEQGTNLYELGASLFLSVMAFYGRITANKTITK